MIKDLFWTDATISYKEGAWKVEAFALIILLPDVLAFSNALVDIIRAYQPLAKLLTMNLDKIDLPTSLTTVDTLPIF